eukprot:scaffold75070_cov31-Prasinocladus_malaysianus.AAC.1
MHFGTCGQPVACSADHAPFVFEGVFVSVRCERVDSGEEEEGGPAEDGGGVDAPPETAEDGKDDEPKDDDSGDMEVEAPAEGEEDQEGKDEEVAGEEGQEQDHNPPVPDSERPNQPEVTQPPLV